jgi:branched-chain amino acid transport system ATP-binding protein
VNSVLRAADLDAGYGQLAVVHNLSLNIDAGEVVALLGPNGAGKTTTLRTLAGELRPLAGRVEWDGRAVSTPPHRRARDGLAVVTEERSVFKRLSTRDNLRVARVAPATALETFPELEPLLNVKAGDLSGGEQQMLSLARALGRKPRALLVDELSLGLAPLIVSRLLAVIRAAADRGVAVMLIEQQVQEALRISDRAYVMRKGLVEISGSAAAVLRRLNDDASSYLGFNAVDASGAGAAGRPDIERINHSAKEQRAEI